MIVTFNLQGPKLQHMMPKQFGAFVAYCYTLKNFHSVRAFKTYIEVSFNLGNMIGLAESAKLQDELNAAIEAFSSMEPFPCPCGCGAFISVSPCFRQSGEIMSGELTSVEIAALKSGNPIEAIKLYRSRTNKGLKESKDAIDNWLATVSQEWLDTSKMAPGYIDRNVMPLRMHSPSQK